MLSAELWNFRRRRQFPPFFDTDTASSGRAHKDPRVTIAFFAGEAAGKDAINFEFAVGCKRRNLGALTAHGFKFPAVITALQNLAIEFTARERNASVGTIVPHGEEPAGIAAADHQRNSQQHRLVEFADSNALAAHGWIPKVEEHDGVWLQGRRGRLGRQRALRIFARGFRLMNNVRGVRNGH